MSRARDRAEERVCALVLAAGAGRRLGGRPKALLRLGGATFLELVVRACRQAGLDEVVVVVGHHAELVAAEARRLGAVVARNPEPDRGMGSSARQGALAAPEGSALLVWPVDTPAVRAETLVALLRAGRERPDLVVLPEHRLEPGHPTLLPARLLEPLRALADDGRLDRMIEAETDRVLRLPVDDPGVLADVDLPGDLERLGRS